MENQQEAHFDYFDEEMKRQKVQLTVMQSI